MQENISTDRSLFIRIGQEVARVISVRAAIGIAVIWLLVQVYGAALSEPTGFLWMYGLNTISPFVSTFLVFYLLGATSQPRAIPQTAQEPDQP